MSIESVVDLVEMLGESQILRPGHIQEVARLQTIFAEPRALAAELIRRGWLTAYQINKLFQGRATELVLGPYVLLERLGEGGMGTVFKARHQLMNRIVALKVIREDRLTSPKAIERFHQEIQATAKLAHPNVVTAHDAAQAGKTHFLVMEYVEGIDLDKRLRQQGALPVPEACAYIRQAALGLQHAHERGLVHRDIKPSNLLVGVPDGVVKIFDLGLARSRTALESDRAGNRLTQEGSIMGSPDYLAPEQALDSSKVDIRADIYSLGCTFYHLLAGRPPFPGGTLAEKILKHQQTRPDSVALFCPGLAPELCALIEKMVAKRPEDRLQMPSEVAEALEPFARQSSFPAAPVPAILTGPLANLLPQATTVDKIASSSANTEFPLIAARKRRTLGNRPWLVPAGVGAAVLVIGMVVLAVFLRSGDRSTDSQEEKSARATDKAGNRPGKNGGQKSDADSSKPIRPKPRPRLKESPALLWELKGHTGPVQCLGFAPHGRTLASGADDQRVRLWNLKTGKELDNVLKHDESVRALAWSRDGKWLATGGLGGYESIIKLWDPTGVQAVAVLQWKEKTGTPMRGEIHALAFSPNGKTLAAAGGPVQLWKLERESEPVLLEWQKTYPSYVYGLTFSPDGKTVVAGCHEMGDAVRRWDLGTREELSVLVGNKSAFGLAHSDIRSVVAFSPDYKMLARVTSNGTQAATSSVMVWDVAEIGKRAIWRDTLEVPAGRVFAAIIFPDGEMFVAIAQGKSDGAASFRNEPFTDKIKLWDSASKKVRIIKTGHRQPVISLAFSSDGQRLATGSDDGTVRVWELAAAHKGAE